MRLTTMAAVLLMFTAVCRGGENKVHHIDVTYESNNEIAKCEGDADDLLDFLQIHIIEQRREDQKYWGHSEADPRVRDWLHARHLGARREFVKVAGPVYSGEPLRIDLKREFQKKGFSNAIGIWNAEKAKSFFEGRDDEKRTLRIKNPTPAVK